MAKPAKPTGPAPITKDELGDFLIWFFTQPGYCDIVDKWRARAADAEPTDTRARTEE